MKLHNFRRISVEIDEKLTSVHTIVNKYKIYHTYMPQALSGPSSKRYSE